jgi:hypothetical protein
VSALEEVVQAADPALRSHSLLPTPYPQERFDSDFVLTAVREAYLLHYAESRAFKIDDPDLRLLGGDSLYALGLARLAEEGDLPAVAMLASLITGCARAHAEGRPEEAARLWSEASR